MRTTQLLQGRSKFGLVFAIALVLFVPQLHAQWTATIGAQSADLSWQALAFLPNEMWIHAGDSITWTIATDEPHTLTLLTATQVRNPFFVGCPGYSSSPATFDGSTCVSSPPLAPGQAFTVAFPTAGNFKISCLFHENMTGIIHVRNASQSLPHEQAFYDNEAKQAHTAVLGGMGGHAHNMAAATGNRVTAGTGAILATGGGSHTVSLVRFMQGEVTIHAGGTVQWTNQDPITPHTITFGTEPQDVQDPSADVTVDADGSRHAIIREVSDSTNSGFIQAGSQDRIGLPQSAPGVTRFRVTFTKAGRYPYICALHDGLGMKGVVVVLP
jgi:plastocyanin